MTQLTQVQITTYTRTGSSEATRETWIVKTDRSTTAQGLPMYISRMTGESLTAEKGNARTWTTYAGAARWLAQTGWAGHAQPVQRLGIYV